MRIISLTQKYDDDCELEFRELAVAKIVELVVEKPRVLHSRRDSSRLLRMVKNHRYYELYIHR